MRVISDSAQVYYIEKQSFFQKFPRECKLGLRELYRSKEATRKSYTDFVLGLKKINNSNSEVVFKEKKFLNSADILKCMNIQQKNIYQSKIPVLAAIDKKERNAVSDTLADEDYIRLEAEKKMTIDNIKDKMLKKCL